MARDNFNGLLALLAVARERSFTRAAARLGVSQSALSHTIRTLETRLGVRLLIRTTRSVSPTEAGERLISSIGPKLEEIEADIDALSELREQPKGMLRITASDYAIRSILWPRLAPFLKQYPDIQVELSSDYRLVDIAAQGFDAGVRLGEQVDKDMIAVRIGPDFRFALVASKAFLAKRPRLEGPQDLLSHPCINLRLPTHGGLYAWEFARDGRALNVRVEGQAIFHSVYEEVQAALDGLGYAYVPEDLVAPYIASGQLRQVLQAWCPTWTGHHLYYPSRRQPSRAMALLIETLRYPL